MEIVPYSRKLNEEENDSSIKNRSYEQFLRESPKNYYKKKIGNYKNKVECFGGEISTVFVAIKGLILEFVANVQKK